MSALIRALSDAFARADVISAICVAIVIGACAVGWAAVRRYAYLRRDVREAERALILSPAAAQAAQRIDGSFADASPIRVRLQRALADITVLDERPYRLVGRHDTLDDVIEAYVDVNGFEAWPNIFVGIGLLFTFLGLALSLINASIGASSDQIDAVRQSVTLLLEFSAAKFSTSLVALFCSLVLGGLLRRQRRSAEVAIAALESVLERSFPALTSERVALVTLKTIQEYCRREGLIPQ